MKKINRELRYTTINHKARKELGVGMIEYCILDSIMKTQKNGYSWMSKEYISNFLGVSERHIFDCIKKLSEKGYLEKSANGRLIKVEDKVIDILIYEDTSDFEDKTMKIVHTNYEDTSYNNNINNNILSKDNIEDKSSKLEKFNKNSSLLSIFHTETTNRGLEVVKDNKFDRIFCNHINNNKDIIRLSAGDVHTFVKRVIKASDELDFWKGKILTPKSFYSNYAKVINEYKIKKNGAVVSRPVVTDEAKQKAINDMINNF